MKRKRRGWIRRGRRQEGLTSVDVLCVSEESRFVFVDGWAEERDERGAVDNAIQNEKSRKTIERMRGRHSVVGDGGSRGGGDGRGGGGRGG